MVSRGTDARVSFRRSKSYNTRSNRTTRFRTPGGVLQIHYNQKAAAGPKCGMCGKGLAGIPCLRPTEYRNIKKSQRTVSRAYGGSICAQCTKQRVLRAFIVEEHKIVRKVLSEKAKAPKA